MNCLGSLLISLGIGKYHLHSGYSSMKPPIACTVRVSYCGTAKYLTSLLLRNLLVPLTRSFRKLKRDESEMQRLTRW